MRNVGNLYTIQWESGQFALKKDVVRISRVVSVFHMKLGLLISNTEQK